MQKNRNLSLKRVTVTHSVICLWGAHAHSRAGDGALAVANFDWVPKPRPTICLIAGKRTSAKTRSGQ